MIVLLMAGLIALLRPRTDANGRSFLRALASSAGRKASTARATVLLPPIATILGHLCESPCWTCAVRTIPLPASCGRLAAASWHPAHYILGPEVEAFEEAAAEVAGARFAVGLSSGTDAILAALMAFDIGPGDEVICPSFTFFATGGLHRARGRPPRIRGFPPGVLQHRSRMASKR